MANRTKVYPEWVEKYRGPGRTIRQLKNGYALYHCSSRYRPGEHPLVQQTYLGMITEADGFIPKKAKGDKIRYLEYGLSHVIWRNFLPELRNAVNARNAKDNLVVHLWTGRCGDIWRILSDNSPQRRTDRIARTAIPQIS